MLKRFWILPLVILLAACGTTSTADGGKTDLPVELSVSVDDLTKGEGFLIRIENDKVLVNDTLFTIDGETHLVSLGSEGEVNLSVEDLKPGMKVDVYHSGMMLQSFPAQGYANVFVIKKDEQSLKEAEAFQAFLEKENRSELVIMGQIDYQEDLIIFNFTDMNDGLSYNVKLDIDTKNYTIEPHTQ